MSKIASTIAWILLATILITSFAIVTSEDRQQISVLSEDLMQRQRLLHRLESLPQKEDNIRAALELLDDGLAERSLYFGELTNLHNEIQRDVRALATSNNVRINSMRPLGVRRLDEEIILSAIQINYQATPDTTLEFINAIELSEPILRVQRMTIAIQSASSDYQPAQLAVNMELAGYSLASDGEGRIP